MVLKMKNFNILGVHWKVQLLGGFMKNQYRGWDCLKRGGGAWTVCRFIREGLARKKEVMFLRGVDTSMRTMRVVQNLIRNLFFVSKMTRIWWVFIWALKSLKNLHFDWSILCKAYNVWPKKVKWSIFHDTQQLSKIWRKTDLWFGNDMRNLANFYQNTWKC